MNPSRSISLRSWTEVEPLRARLARHPGWNEAGRVPPVPERIPELAAFLRTVAAYDALAGARKGDEVGDDPAEPEPLPPLPRTPGG